jgi:hypothetical protein
MPNKKSIFHLAVQFPSGNAMVKKTVFKSIGLFDRQFEGMRMGDGEFGARCIKNGLLLISNPEAFCEDVKAPEGGLREMGSWDAFRPKNILAARPVPSTLYLYRKYWGNIAAIFQLIQTLPFSYSPYKLKGRKIGYFISIFIFIIFMPFVMVQVILSWKLSNRMLKTGGLIGKI